MKIGRWCSGDLTHKHGGPEVLTGGFSGEELLLPVRHMSALTVMLRAFRCQETGT